MLAAISVMNQLYDKPNLTSVGKPPVDTILFSLALFFCFFICGGKCLNHILMTWLSTYHWAGKSEDPWFRKKWSQNVLNFEPTKFPNLCFPHSCCATDCGLYPFRCGLVLERKPWMLHSHPYENQSLPLL